MAYAEVKSEYTASEEAGTVTKERRNLEAIRLERIGRWTAGSGDPPPCLNRPSEAETALYGGPVPNDGKSEGTLDRRFSGSLEDSGELPDIRIENRYHQPLRHNRNVAEPGCYVPEPQWLGRATVDVTTAFEDRIVPRPNLNWIGIRNPFSVAESGPLLAEEPQRIATSKKGISTACLDRARQQ